MSILVGTGNNWRKDGQSGKKVTPCLSSPTTKTKPAGCARFYYSVFFILVVFSICGYFWRLSVVDPLQVASAALSNVSFSGPRAAMFTPYHLTPGGGERYILSSALVMQDLGYFVTIMVPHDATVRTISQLKETTKALRISLDYSRLNLEVVRVNHDNSLSHLNGRRITKFDQYDVFYLLGNSKLPFIRPVGSKFNIYMCQFPFDYLSPDKESHLDLFSEYDSVLLNSRFTHSWYAKSAVPSFQSLVEKGLTTPTVSILFPPVEPFPAVWREAATAHNDSITRISTSSIGSLIPFHERDASGTFNIVMLGRFFTGRQSKGHFAALRILENIISSLPEVLRSKVHLSMMGKIQPELKHVQYAAEVKGNATVRKLPVSFLHNVPPETLESTLQRSHVFWHLTGIDVINGKESSDPASLEHFGISVVEAMSAGCVPIVLSIGGTTDIVQNGVNGYYANGEADFVQRTLEIMRSSGFLRRNGVMEAAASLQALSESAVARSREFHLDVFRKNLYLLVQRGVLSAHFRKVMATNQLAQHPLTSTCGFSVSANARNVALIVAANIDGGLRSITHNVVEHLPEGWGLVVVHSADSESFVKMSLQHIRNVRYIALPDSFSITSVKDYNNLMFSAQFWRSIEADKVLLFQTDSIILHHGIESYMKYDYIGAPWNERENERVKRYIAEGKLRHAVGNGGFSLRTVSAMVTICERHAQEANNGSVETEQEDLYVARSFEALGYKVAPVDVAYRFSTEVPLRHLSSAKAVTSHTPFALHAAWYYWAKEDIDRWLDFAKQPTQSLHLRSKVSTLVGTKCAQ